MKRYVHRGRPLGLSISLLPLLTLLIFLMSTLSACRRQADTVPEPSEPVVTLRAITMGTPPASGLDPLYKELDALTIPELGCVLRFHYIPWGDERNQINLAIASNEYDFIPGGNFSDYRLMAPRNAFLDLSEYLPLVPDLVEHYQRSGKDILELIRIDGKLYGIPQYDVPGIDAAEGFFFREDLRQEWGISPVKDLDTMEEYLYRAKADSRYADLPLITDNRIWSSLWYMLSKDDYLEITSITESQYAVIHMDDPYTVVSRMETPEFLQMLRYIEQWHTDGILEGELLASQGNEGTKGLALIVADHKPCETNSPLWVLNDTWIPKLYEEHPEWEFGFFSYLLDGRSSEYKGSSTHSTVITVSSKTRYPETAIQLLEKLHTDPRYYYLLAYGVEGENYYKSENGVIYYEGIPSENRYRGWTGAADGYMSASEAPSPNRNWNVETFEPFYEENLVRLETAEFNPLDDFVFDKEEVLAFSDGLTKAWTQYMHPLLCGVVEQNVEADLALALEKLYEAGLEEYLQILQQQLDTFAITQGKQ